MLDSVLPTIQPSGGDILEIGFGNGENMIRLAEENPDKIIIGAEPYINGVASLLSRITEQSGRILPQYENIRIYPGDVRELLSGITFQISKIYILHPDPWPKARHEKRRLLSKEFLNAIAARLKPDGEIIIGTDHTDYYDWIKLQVENTKLKIKSSKTDTIETKYQRKNMFGSAATMYLVLTN